MRKHSLARVALSLGAVAALALPHAAFALTKLEGYYSMQLDIRKQDRSYQWDYDANSGDGSDWNYAELRILTTPRPGVEAFLKTYAQWNPGSNSDRRPSFFLQESHAKYRVERGPRAYEALLFSRERRYWVDNHLIGVVYDDRASNDGNADGVRLETWGPGGFNAVYAFSDFAGQSTPGNGAQADRPKNTDDAHIVRVKRNFLPKNKLRVGLTNALVVRAPQSIIFPLTDSTGTARDTSTYVNVLAGDTRISLGGTDVSIEYAQTFKPGWQYTSLVERRWCTDTPSGLSLGRLNDGLWRALPSNSVFRAEVRSLRVGTPRTGYFYIAPSYRVLGRQWDNPLGDGTRDEAGYYLNSWYALPQRAITLTGNYGNYDKRYDESAHWSDAYAEMYTEYLNGFTSKLFYRSRRGSTGPGRGSDCTTVNAGGTRYNQDIREYFGEVTAQSTLAWARLQFKARRVVEGYRLTHQQLASFESNVNLTPALKLYSRLTFGNDATRTRTSTFVQGQYRPRDNMELFVSYGPWWIGDSTNPVDDGDLAGSGENRDIFKVELHGWF